MRWMTWRALSISFYLAGHLVQELRQHVLVEPVLKPRWLERTARRLPLLTTEFRD
jgi:hypothetical protein